MVAFRGTTGYPSRRLKKSASIMAREHLPSLLLLPSPPEPATRASLNKAYRPPLETALSKVKTQERSAILIIAVAFPLLKGDNPSFRSLSWPDAQSLLAELYSIISVVCTTQSIDIDARVVLIDYAQSRTFADFQPAIEPNDTVVVDLPTFACAYHPWNYIFHVENEAGLQLHAAYLKFAEGVQTLRNDQLVPLDGGPATHAGEPGGAAMFIPTATHEVVCLGGTFDHLHLGHKLLLTAGALLLRVPELGAADPCQFIIGVTGDEMLKNKKYAEYMQSWQDRARSVVDFVSSILELSRSGWEERPAPEVSQDNGDLVASFRNGTITVRCVEFQDAYGPTITNEAITSLVVSGETRSGGIAVNERRAELGWHLLELFEVDVLEEEITDERTKTEHSASKISSTAIRQQKAKAGQHKIESRIPSV